MFSARPTSSTEYRARYAGLVKMKTLMKVWATITVGLALRAYLFFGKRPAHYSSVASGCFYWDDTILLAAVIIFSGGPLMFLAFKLYYVQDAFKLREECGYAFAGGCLFATTILVIQVLVTFELLPEGQKTHVAVEVLALLLGLNFGLWGLLIPMARVHRGGWRSWTRTAIVPVENNVYNQDFHGVLAIASAGGGVADHFATFCRENLTLESWEFILDALEYEKMDSLKPGDDQFERFLHILERYLLSTSPEEVNIAGTTSKRMASFGTRVAFSQLDVDARKKILQEPLNEVVHMLEQNLLAKFQCVLAQKEAQLAAAAEGDRELAELMTASLRRASGG